MISTINIIIETLQYIIAIAIVLEFYNRKHALLCYFPIEFIHKMLGTLILSAEDPVTRSLKIVLYLIFMLVRFWWFVKFVKEPERNFCLAYIYAMPANIMGVIATGWVSRMLRIDPNAVVDYVLTEPDVLPARWILGTFVMAAFVLLYKSKLLAKVNQKVLWLAYGITLMGEVVPSIYLCANRTDYYYEGMALYTIPIILEIVCLVLYHRKTMLEWENQQLHSKLLEQERYHEILQQVQRELRKLRHDLANHMQVLHEMTAIFLIAAGLFWILLTGIRLYVPWAWGIDAKLMWVIAGALTAEAGLCIVIFIKIRNTYLESVKYHQAVMAHTYKIQQMEEDYRELEEFDESILLPEQQLLRQIDDWMDGIDTGNQVVDILLHEKEQKSKDYSIACDVEVHLPEDIAVSEVDLVRMFGNLTDNAIESCMKVDDSDRYLKIHSCIKANYLTICMENSKRSDEYPLKRNLVTTKQDSIHHGLGMKILKNLARKYDGELTCKDEGTVFITTLNIRYR